MQSGDGVFSDHHEHWLVMDLYGINWDHTGKLFGNFGNYSCNGSLRNTTKWVDTLISA